MFYVAFLLSQSTIWGRVFWRFTMRQELTRQNPFLRWICDRSVGLAARRLARLSATIIAEARGGGVERVQILSAMATRFTFPASARNLVTARRDGTGVCAGGRTGVCQRWWRCWLSRSGQARLCERFTVSGVAACMVCDTALFSRSPIRRVRSVSLTFTAAVLFGRYVDVFPVCQRCPPSNCDRCVDPSSF